MPELPEVETTRRGIDPHVKGKKIRRLVVREPRLRWPVSDNLAKQVASRRILATGRRGKYLLLHFAKGSLIIHLGMSGNLRVMPDMQPPDTHDHLDLVFSDNSLLRYSDPRRFGSIHWADCWAEHKLLRNLGPEPFDSSFDADYLYRRARGRKVPIKNFIMNTGVVVGIGNIYANEALFQSGIHPLRAAGRISHRRFEVLIANIRRILEEAIAAGGTTLKDFLGNEGKPGYFSVSLQAYGRGGQPCYLCSASLKEIRCGNRSTVYCPSCQT